MAARAMLKVWRRDDDNDDHEDAPIMDTSGNLYPDHDDDDDYYNSQSWVNCALLTNAERTPLTLW